jgi:hypothetical protein
MWEGLILGTLTFIGIYLIYRKLPRLIKKVISKLSLITDLLATAVVYLTISAVSGSFAALIACATVGIFISFGLERAKDGV